MGAPQHLERDRFAFGHYQSDRSILLGIKQEESASWSSGKPQVTVAHHNFSSSSNQPDLSISLLTTHQSGNPRRRCCWIEAVISLFCPTVVPRRSRDSVSGDVSFRRPPVELFIVTMHSWAQLRHTKSGFHPTKSMSYWPKLYHDVFDASAHAFK